MPQQNTKTKPNGKYERLRKMYHEVSYDYLMLELEKERLENEVKRLNQLLKTAAQLN